MAGSRTISATVANTCVYGFPYVNSCAFSIAGDDSNNPDPFYFTEGFLETPSLAAIGLPDEDCMVFRCIQWCDKGSEEP